MLTVQPCGSTTQGNSTLLMGRRRPVWISPWLASLGEREGAVGCIKGLSANNVNTVAFRNVRSQVRQTVP